MKVIMMWVMAMMFSAVAVIAGADDNFAVKADEYGKKVEAIEKKLSRLEIRNSAITETINHLKGQKAGVIRDFFLWYFLVRGNKISYKIEAAELKLSEIKDDYFTYSALVLEEHNRRFKACLKEKCPDAAEIFAQRRAWSDKVINFKDVFELDINYGLAAGDSSDSKDDVREYYAKKMMQAEQRLIILNDENSIIAEAKKAGIVSDVMKTDNINKKIKEMMQIKKKLETLPASAGGR